MANYAQTALDRFLRLDNAIEECLAKIEMSIKESDGRLLPLVKEKSKLKREQSLMLKQPEFQTREIHKRLAEIMEAVTVSLDNIEGAKQSAQDWTLDKMAGGGTVVAIEKLNYEKLLKEESSLNRILEIVQKNQEIGASA